jgi:nucleotide-binding universal stress UspA family protein
MATPGSIVVGTDGSDRAEVAVTRAGELGKLIGATVHVVSGYSSKGADGPGPAAFARGLPLGGAQVDDGNRRRAQQNVDRAEQLLSGAGVQFESHIWSGDPAEALLQIASEKKAQMIIVGNRGMTGARRLLGSVPNHISHHAACDVLIVSTS